MIQRFPRIAYFPRADPTRKSPAEIAQILSMEYPYPTILDTSNYKAAEWGDYVTRFEASLPDDTLRAHCRKHGLSDEGDYMAMLTRLYLHWKAFKLKLGFPLVGYGIGYERVNNPSCVCSCLDYRRESKAMIRCIREQHQRFSRMMQFPRIPRYPRTIRFPRFLKPTKYSNLWYDVFRNTVLDKEKGLV